MCVACEHGVGYHEETWGAQHSGKGLKQLMKISAYIAAEIWAYLQMVLPRVNIRLSIHSPSKHNLTICVN